MTAKQAARKSTWFRRVAALLLLLAIAPTLLFGLRTYGSFVLAAFGLRSGRANDQQHPTLDDA